MPSAIAELLGLPGGPPRYSLDRPRISFPPPRSAGTIKATPKTIGGEIERGITAILKQVTTEKRAHQLAQRIMAPLTDVTPVGNVVGAEEGGREFYRGLTQGDLRAMGLGAGTFGLSVLPIPGGARKGATKGIRELLEDESGAIRAWHGSPHDFDKFEWSPRTRGTGEGAQAYGDGLYFAENRGVADNYRKQLAGYGHAYTIDGEDFGKINDLPTARRAYAKLAPDLSPLKQVDERAPDFVNSYGPVALGGVVRDIDYTKPVPFEEMLADVAAMHRAAAEKAADPRDKAERLGKALIAENMARRAQMRQAGHLYEVNINAEPEDFLDWDAPLAQQPKAMAALNAIDLDKTGAMSRTRTMLNWARQGTEQPHNPATGRELLNALSNYGESRTGDLTALQPYGIKGVRYLDQGSRGAAQGTRNFVVPDASLIDILNKY